MVGGRVVAPHIVDMNMRPSGDVRGSRADARSVFDDFLSRRDRAPGKLMPDRKVGPNHDAGVFDQDCLSREDARSGHEDVVSGVEKKETPIRIAARLSRIHRSNRPPGTASCSEKLSQKRRYSSR